MLSTCQAETLRRDRIATGALLVFDRTIFHPQGRRQNGLCLGTYSEKDTYYVTGPFADMITDHTGGTILSDWPTLEAVLILDIAKLSGRLFSQVLSLCSCKKLV